MIVTASLGCGGLEKITTEIANYYVRRGWGVRILCLMSYDKSIFYKLSTNVEVVFFNIKRNRKNIFNVPGWISFIKHNMLEFNPSHILAMTLKIGALCSLSKKNRLIRLSMREISDPKSSSRSRFVDRILFLLCGRIDSIIFQTNWEKQCYPMKMQKKGHVIPNPCNVDESLFSKERTNTIVSVGRLINKQKKHDVLIKSFYHFFCDNPNYILKIYGDGPDLFKDKILVRELGIEDKVEFCGNVNNIQQQIIDAKCFVLTSDFEGMSNALLEAYLLGIPCVTTDWPGVSDVIQDGIDGLIVKRGDILSISCGIKKIVENESLAMTLANNAIKQRKRYDLKNILVEYSKQIEGETKYGQI